MTKSAPSTDSAKQRVLKRYPQAVSKQWTARGELYWLIERDMTFSKPPLGRGGNATAAWANAARRINGR